MDQEFVFNFFDAIGKFIKQKKIRFVVGKVNTGIQINISHKEASDSKVDAQFMQQVLPIIYNAATSIITDDRETALLLIRNIPIFASISDDQIIELLEKTILTKEFMRNYYHRTTTVGPVLDSMYGHYVFRPSQDRDKSPDLPSVQFVMRTRGSTDIDNFEERVLELSVDDVNHLYNFFSEVKETLQKHTKGTMYYLEENE